MPKIPDKPPEATESLGKIRLQLSEAAHFRLLDKKCLNFKKMFICLPWVLVAAHRLFNLCCGMQILSYGMWDLVLWPRSKPRPPPLGEYSLRHWTTRVVPRQSIFVVLSHQVAVPFKMAALGNQHSFQRQETLFVKTRNLVSYLGRTLILKVSMLWNPLEGLLKYKLLGFTLEFLDWCKDLCY